MRIIHVEDYFDPTAGYQINELIYANRDFEDEVIIITSTDMSPFHKKISIESDYEFEKTTGVKIIRLRPLLKISTRLILRNLWRTINKLKPDVLFVHGVGDFKDLILFGNKKDFTIVRDCHMSWIASQNKFRRIYFFLFKHLFSRIINSSNKYQFVYALGDEEYEYLVQLGISNEKIKYLRHGYNPSIMYYDEKARKEIRRQYNFSDNDIVISYIGKFDYHKRPDLLIDIIDKFDIDYINDKNIKLLFIGPKDYEYMKLFNDKISKIENKISYIVDESKEFKSLRKFYSAVDICVFPKETTLSAIHAQICGCPVVMENHKSNLERVVLRKNLFDIDNLEEANTVINSIITNQEYNKTLGIEVANKLQNRNYRNQIQEVRNLSMNN